MADKKRTGPLDWEDLRYFVALARHGSLSAAARALRVNHATVARRVASLESALGRLLFDRRRDGYALTGAGKAVLDEAGAMEEAASSLLHRLDGGAALGGLVRVTAARVLADGFLIERLGGLRERHPGIDIELIAEARVLSLSRREADIALRLGRPKDSDLVARRLAAIAFGYYVSADYRKRLAAGEPPALVGFDAESDFMAEAQWMGRRFPDGRFAFRSNSQTSQAAAARAGYGVALLPTYLAAADPRLVRIPFGELPSERELWLLMRRDLARLPRVRAVADFLVELFCRERRLLASR